MFIHKPETICSRKTSYETNYSIISSNRNFSSLKKIRKKTKNVTFKEDKKKKLDILEEFKKKERAIQQKSN